MNKKGVVIDNSNLSLILFKIAGGKNYNQILAEDLDIKPASVIEQVQRLEKEDFIFIEEEKKQKYNKKVYSINWKKILEEFANHIEKTLYMRREQLKLFESKDIEEEINKNIEISIRAIKKYESIEKKILNNSNLEDIFKRLFYNISVIPRCYHNITIREVFNELILLFAEAIQKGEVKSLFENFEINNDSEFFVQLSMICVICAHNVPLKYMFLSVFRKDTKPTS